LTPVELEHVLLHERAHIARRDQWANLLARFVGVFFGLHPVAALALHRIERERERACDDWVVAATGDARPYAASLTRVFELTRRGAQPDLASGFMGSRLGGRIEELLMHGRSYTKRVSMATLAAIAVAVVILSVRTPSTVAYAQEKGKVIVPPATPTPATAAAQPAKPVKPAPAKDQVNVVADRLEALIERLEAALDRVNQVPQSSAGTIQQLMREEQNLVNANARLAAAQAEIQAREADMKNQQRQVEQLRLQVERAMQEMKAQQELKEKQQVNPQYR
jgi:hypothetical protein